MYVCTAYQVSERFEKFGFLGRMGWKWGFWWGWWVFEFGFCELGGIDLGLEYWRGCFGVGCDILDFGR